VAVVLLAGCGDDGKPTVPVSGRVTLDGEAVSEARVSFEPIGDGTQLDLGLGSVGKTDDDGRYVLETIDRRPGALPGEHRVRISTFQMARDLTKKEVIREEEIPARYSGDTELTFEVPPKGTDAADFELVTEPDSE